MAVDETVLELVRQHMRDDAKVATAYDKVYKDECMFCFATSESPGGLYINLRTFQAFDEAHVDLDQERTGAVLYLHEQAHRVPLSDEEQQKQQDAPDKMAIGVEGGFQVDAKKYKIEKEYALVLMPARLRVELPCPDLPELVLNSVTSVQAHDSANVQANVEAWQEERAVSKYAEGLEQLPAGRTIPMDPKQWKCDETGVTENLWLNLSTGFIGSGRPQWDGSGGNGSALRHFEATGKKYPLVVKLGTITPHGADVFSYADDENDMVLDPLLAKHLAHWGINMLQMEKTEKTMAEMQIDLNMRHEFDKITEAGAHLQPLHGPGYVGLKNLGNSCYMNSVLQLLWTLPPLQLRYAAAAAQLFKTAPADAASDFPSQFAKVGVALVEGRTGKPGGSVQDPMAFDAVTVSTEGGLEGVAEGTGPGDEWTVAPASFKTLVGRGHPEFSSMRQQDAEEYFAHLLEVMSRAERAAGEARLPGAAAEPTGALFRFQLEDRIQCTESGRVAYRRGASTVLGLEIPLEAATNAAELDSYQQRQLKRQKLLEEGGGEAKSGSGEEEARVIPIVPFAACLGRFAGDSLVEDYHSAALGRKTQASKRVRFGSFPPYLLVQLRRYYVALDWTPKKMEVLVEVPDQLDLEHLRGGGPQPEEQLQPEDDAQPAAGAAPAAAAAPTAPEPDETIVAQLVSMGFSENGSKRAALAVSNSGAEAAMEWVFAHMTDPDFNDPPQQQQQPAATAGVPAPAAPAPSAEALSSLTAMGFTERQATGALAACQGSLERAADWLFSHMDDLDSAVEAALAPAQQSGGGGAGAAGGEAGGGAAKVLDGAGKYELVGFISHMGANTACGHYVAHLKKEGRWVIFNDEKVAVSEKPPRDLGYLYLFRRADMAA